MIIKTYCKNIDLDRCREITYDFIENRLSFINGDNREDLYFYSKNRAIEFYMEIIEGIHNDLMIVDLSHFVVIYGNLNIDEAQFEIRERILKFKYDEKK